MCRDASLVHVQDAAAQAAAREEAAAKRRATQLQKQQEASAAAAAAGSGSGGFSGGVDPGAAFRQPGVAGHDNLAELQRLLNRGGPDVLLLYCSHTVVESRLLLGVLL
jgi:hypothetical protein